jgi:hypothetical protein
LTVGFLGTGTGARDFSVTSGPAVNDSSGRGTNFVLVFMFFGLGPGHVKRVLLFWRIVSLLFFSFAVNGKTSQYNNVKTSTCQ